MLIKKLNNPTSINWKLKAIQHVPTFFKCECKMWKLTLNFSFSKKSMKMVSIYFFSSSKYFSSWSSFICMQERTRVNYIEKKIYYFSILCDTTHIFVLFNESPFSYKLDGMDVDLYLELQLIDNICIVIDEVIWSI